MGVALCATDTLKNAVGKHRPDFFYATDYAGYRAAVDSGDYSAYNAATTAGAFGSLSKARAPSSDV